VTVPATLSRLPLVGRAADLSQLRAGLDRARAGNAGILLLVGEPGVGKSRLMSVAADEARRGGWTVAAGRAYPLEAGAPYALFADAFVPLLRDLEPGRLKVLVRGAEAQLAHLFPVLGSGARAPDGLHEVHADRTQLFWTFAELLRGLSARQPLLILLDDLHWADVSSLELLHFVARQLTEESIAIVGTVSDAHKDAHPTFATTVQSLLSLGVLEQHRLRPLTREATDELVRQVFGIDERVSREFSALLYGWTRGNPFFIQETLKTLVESGRLRSHEGRWLGWEVAELEMPPTVRDAIRLRTGRLSAPARQVAELVAVMGARSGYDALRRLSGLGEAELVQALEELTGANVLVEGGSPREPVYDFAHPMLALTLHSEIGLARQRMMHAGIAETLEQRYGARALEHADELSRHFSKGHTGDLSPKAVKYLSAAGRGALARFADREAADYLAAALERVDGETEAASAGSGGQDGRPSERYALLIDLGRAKQRLGHFEDAIQLWQRATGEALDRGDPAGAAQALYRIGLARFRTGRYESALRAFGEALEAASTAGGAARLVARIRLARGACLETVGRVAEARGEMEAALAGADDAGDASLRARCHRALLVFHTLVGPPDRAREHGVRAIALAESSGDLALACTCHWGMAVLEGLSGHGEACDHHMSEGVRIAETLNSPLLRLALDEVQVEHAFGRGDWDTGVAMGERAIALARALNQRSILPRLLVWTALIYIGRADLERAKRYVDEAWRLSGADDLTRVADVHSVVPAHIGLATYHTALSEWDEAIRIGKRGLEIVDRTGYTAWAVHRLLPNLAEAQLFKHDVPAARGTIERLRRDANALDHPLGIAWVDAGDAICRYLEGDAAGSVEMLRQAAARLDEVPYVPDAARVRRQLAARLAELGERDAAIRELRRVHEVFVKLGAHKELEKARIQFQEMSARPPARSAGGGTESLTEREVEIVRLVAEHKSNKAIGKALGISPRTVGTHLSNIYGKLEIQSRMELLARSSEILSSADAAK
jgi:DNA-binding CsgD family transcriptional regulator